MTDLLSKLLINLIIFIFIANCKDFKSGKSNQNSSVNSAIVNVANCASVTDLSQCAIAITQDKTICGINYNKTLCVVIPDACAEIVIKEDCSHLKPKCEWQNTACVDKVATSSTTGNATNTSNLATLNETALKEALGKITYNKRKDFVDKILADNSLKDLVRNDKFEPTFWQFINANNSNKILSAGLNDSNLSTEAKIDLIENIFQNNAGNTKPFHDAVPALIDISKVKSSDFSTGEINDENEKTKVTDKLTEIFALGEKAIDSFYKFLIPTTILNLFDTAKSRMSPVVSSAIIDLLIEKNLLNQIVTTEKHVGAMMKVIEKSEYVRKKNHSTDLAGNKKLGQKIVDALNEGPLKQSLKNKVDALPDN